MSKNALVNEATRQDGINLRRNFRVTRMLSRAAAAIHIGRQKRPHLGIQDAIRGLGLDSKVIQTTAVACGLTP